MNLPIQEAIHDSHGLTTRQAGFYTPTNTNTGNMSEPMYSSSNSRYTTRN